jgi:hypothetical protein
MSFANTFIKVYKAKCNIIVALRPRIEEFLLNIAKEVEIDPKDYKLQIMVKNYKGLNKITTLKIL